MIIFVQKKHNFQKKLDSNIDRTEKLDALAFFLVVYLIDAPLLLVPTYHNMKHVLNYNL